MAYVLKSGMGQAQTDCGCGFSVPPGGTCPPLRADCSVIPPAPTLFSSTDPLKVITAPARLLFGAQTGNWGLDKVMLVGGVMWLGLAWLVFGRKR
jgi:hypothetical protein